MWQALHLLRAAQSSICCEFSRDVMVDVSGLIIAPSSVPAS